MKTIPDRYFDELKSSGHTVPRNETTGEPIPFRVGKEYTIKNTKGETAQVRCTQDCPHHIILLPQ